MILSPTNPTSPAYERKKREAARVSRVQSELGRDIGPLPPVRNPTLKAAAGLSFKFFCERYFPHTFALAWSDDHLRVIEVIERAVLQGGLFAMAMPRAAGKTSLAESAALWSELYGSRRFVVLVGSDEGHALGMLESIKAELENNDRLLDDFPEAAYPIRCLQGITHRAAGQLYLGNPTHIGWSSDEVVLPTIPRAVCSGGVIRVRGITGRIRGMKFKRSDGLAVRPDFCIVDDPQSDESARSPSQCANRERTIAGAVLGLAGPGKKISAVMPCTVIEPGDLADRFLDRALHPEWQGERTRMVYAWPTEVALWDEYAEKRANGQRSGSGTQEATEFYLANREAMDAGSKVAWPVRFNRDELSAIQHAFNLRLNVGEEAFQAEYQNDPKVRDGDADGLLTPEQIAAKTNSLKRGVVPAWATCITAFVDVQANFLAYLVAAWGPDFTGAVIDYGTYPDQRRAYWTKRDVRRTLATLAPKGASEESRIWAGLDGLTNKLCSRVWLSEEGVELRLSRCLVDASWGRTTTMIHRFCRSSPHAAVLMPAHGRFVGASSVPWSAYTRKEGEIIGDHWMVPQVRKKRAIRHVLTDINYYKSFVHARLATPEGGGGSLSLWGGRDTDSSTDHRIMGDHMHAEYRVKTEAGGRTVDEWKTKPNGPDNELLDCIVGAAAAASMQNCRLVMKAPAGTANGNGGVKKKRRTAVKYL